MICRLIDRYPEIGKDAVTLTDDNARGSVISMAMIFELHAVAVDDEVDTSVSSRLLLLTTFCTCRLVLLFILHSLFCFPWYYRLWE